MKKLSVQTKEGTGQVLKHYLSVIEPTAVQIEIFREGIQKHKYGIYNKGRRLGATRGAAEAFIEYGLQGKTTLWIDVVQGNIRRYFRAYFKPILKKAGLVPSPNPEAIAPNQYHWDKKDLILSFHSGKTDFRSADYPDRIEGFGYDIVFFNEAGLILNDDYIWANAVMPMMLDNPNSSVIAAGTPKLTLGKGEFFQKLAERRDEGREGYGGRRIPSYENPHLDAHAIELLKLELLNDGYDESVGEAQEIEGQFVDLKALGTFFKVKWFTEKLDFQTNRLVRGWDFAATPVTELSPNPDFTYSCALDVQDDGLVIADTDFLRAGPDEVDEHLVLKLKQDMTKYKKVTYAIPIDPGSAGKTANKHFKDLLNAVAKEHPYSSLTIVEYPQTKNQGSKQNRALPAQHLAKNGEVFFVKQPKIDHFFLQLSSFPNDKVHDDAVDAFSGAVNAISSGKKAFAL